MTAGTNEYSYEHVRVKTLHFLHNITINSSKTNVSHFLLILLTIFFKVIVANVKVA